MVAYNVTAAPFNPVKPILKITQGGNSVQVECASESFEASVEQDETTTETFCGTYTAYKAEVWTITGSVFPSYAALAANAGGLWNALRPMVGDPTATFEFIPDSTQARSASNPVMSGTCLVKAFPFYAGSPGEPTAFDLVLAVQGAPSFTTTAGAAATGGNAGTPGTYSPVGATPVANAAGASGMTANPTTAWTSGQYMKGTSADFYWNGSAWTAGRAP